MTSPTESSQDPTVTVTHVAKTYETPSSSESMKDKLKSSAQSAKDTAKSGMKEVQAQLSNRWDQAKGYLQDIDRQGMSDQVCTKIRQYPWTSIALSFVVGTFIGRKILKR